MPRVRGTPIDEKGGSDTLFEMQGQSRVCTPDIVASGYFSEERRPTSDAFVLTRHQSKALRREKVDIRPAFSRF